MLLKGHAPQSEPFRKWVTEEVLPTIRKTRAYNIHASDTPEANQFAGELAELHVALTAMRAEMVDLKTYRPPLAP
ncbi:hypothetical protein D9M68_343560 [compost metagenome]